MEEGTPFARWYQAGAAPLPSEGAGADQLRAASARLRAAGYEHYELSSYALPGKRRAQANPLDDEPAPPRIAPGT